MSHFFSLITPPRWILENHRAIAGATEEELRHITKSKGYLHDLEVGKAEKLALEMKLATQFEERMEEEKKVVQEKIVERAKIAADALGSLRVASDKLMFDKIDSLEKHRKAQSGEADEIRNAISDLREKTNKKVKHQLNIYVINMKFHASPPTDQCVPPSSQSRWRSWRREWSKYRPRRFRF